MCGRPRKTSPCDDNLIWQIAVWSPTSSYKKIHATLILKGPDVHCTTVNKHLVHKSNLKAFKCEKTHLTPAMKIKRLAYAKQYEDWDEARLSLFLGSIDNPEVCTEEADSL